MEKARKAKIKFKQKQLSGYQGKNEWRDWWVVLKESKEKMDQKAWKVEKEKLKGIDGRNNIRKKKWRRCLEVASLRRWVCVLGRKDLIKFMLVRWTAKARHLHAEARGELENKLCLTVHITAIIEEEKNKRKQSGTYVFGAFVPKSLM